MRTIITIISLTFILYSILGGAFNLFFEYTIAFLLIGLIGMSHGSIDHILATDVLKILPKRKLHFFIATYLSIIALYLFFWFISPFLSFLLFLLYSAYHFGQADTEIITKNIPGRHSKIIGFNYGLIIISTLLIFSRENIISIFPDWFNKSIKLELIMGYCKPIFYSSIITQIAIGILLAIYKKVKPRQIIDFSIQLFIVLLIFSYLPPLIAFSLYFGLWHSLLVLQKEFKTFYSYSLVTSKIDFIKKLAPFTMLSLVGLILIVSFSSFNIHLTTLIAISVLAFPHTIIMEMLYSQKA